VLVTRLEQAVVVCNCGEVTQGNY